MHPARSIILFTSSSGAGYGLLFLLTLLGLADRLPRDPWFAGVSMAVALGLVVVGLLASTFHLGHPERAWRAISQWRSSWLSREGLAALATFLPALAFGWGWLVEGRSDGAWVVAAGLTALGAAVTVFCTAMIYASLKPIRQWRHPLVPPVYLAFALANGALLLLFLLQLWGFATPLMVAVALVLLLLAWGVKGAYWAGVARLAPLATPESATGLGTLGTVRMLEPPHTEENYLLRELGYCVARKHARKLRLLALLCGLLLPAVALLAMLLAYGVLQAPLAGLAVAGLFLGTLTERWLFFAEATHTVTLYYGRRE